MIHMKLNLLWGIATRLRRSEGCYRQSGNSKVTPTPYNCYALFGVLLTRIGGLDLGPAKPHTYLLVDRIDGVFKHALDRCTVRCPFDFRMCNN